MSNKYSAFCARMYIVMPGDYVHVHMWCCSGKNCECCAVLTSHGTRSKSQASTFDQDTLNESQFTQITETFMGDYPNMEVFQHLVRYVRDGYVETEDERMGRLLKVGARLIEACNSVCILCLLLVNKFLLRI